MKYIAIIAILFGIMLFSGCTQQNAPGANNTVVVINATCSDGTPEKVCSANKPFYCAGGELIKSTEKCGCPTNYELSGNSCVRLCSDGTKSGQCTADNTRYCSDGVLVTDNTKCGCSSSAYDLIGGSCVLARCEDNTTLDSCSQTNVSFLCNTNGTLVRDVGECGCPANYTASGEACMKDCSDGTLAGKCNSANKYCDNGDLILNLSKCSCPMGKIACGSSCVVANCTSDSNCYDGNSDTADKCLSPGTCNATCSNPYYTARVFSYSDTKTMNDLEFSINSIDDLGRNWSYTSNNGTDYILTSSSSSKKFIEVSVTIEAKDDYDFEVSQDSFYLIDDDNITYNPVCASKYNKTTTSTSSCYNDNAFESYDSLTDGDVVEGSLYFEIPKSNDPWFFAFRFDDSFKPGEIWFEYD
jgi:hypothetical protein